MREFTVRIVRKGATSHACVAATALIVAPAPAFAGDIFFETHTFTHHVTAPEAGSTYEEVFALPMFDTMGGTRNLLAFIEAYGPVDDAVILGTATIAANPSLTDTIGSRVRWSLEWTGEIGGEQFFPAHPDLGGIYSVLGTESALQGPESAGFTTKAGGGVSFDRQVTDPAKLAVLTGTGTVDVTGKLIMGEFTYEPLTGPGVPPDTIFDPNLITIEWESFDLQVTVHYMYEVVPAPGPLALLGFGGLGMCWRRRRG